MQNSIVVELCCTIRANSSLTFAAGFRRQHGRAGNSFVLHEGVDDDVGNDGQQQHRLKAQELAAEVERLQRRLSPNIHNKRYHSDACRLGEYPGYTLVGMQYVMYLQCLLK